MSAALKYVIPICSSSLRFSRAACRIKAPAVLPLCAFLHSTHRLAYTVQVTRQPVGSGILSPLVDSKPLSDRLVNISSADIITLKECLDSGNLLKGCKHLMGLGVTVPPAVELNSAAVSESASLGNYITDSTLQPVVSQLFETLTADVGETLDAPEPLELLGRMNEIGVARVSHYTTLLLETIRRYYTSADNILPVFEASITFSSEYLRELMHVASELYSFKIDTATPHFIALLILQDLLKDRPTASDSLTRLQNVVRLSQYPTIDHTERFLNYHNFPSPMTRNILDLQESYSSATLFTNHFTILQMISRARTPEELTDLYTRVCASNSASLSPQIYTRFVTSYLEYGCQDQSSACWKDMINSGIIPTVVQWNELLKTFSKSDSKMAITQLWSKMLLDGCIPDDHCWTTRIHSLLGNNHVAAGLECLREMQKVGITPITETINAALDGLLKHGHVAEAEAVLSTADKLGIARNLWTYNILLQRLMKEQKTDSKKFGGIITLTKEMQAEGIVPDIQTVTLILDGMYKYASPRPSLSWVIGLLAYIESVGIEINTVTYTSILHGLLQEGNEPAAMGILGIMADRGVVGNSATYTVLLKYYFTRSDLVSAEKVLAEMEEKRIPADSRVYRELVCGFAACRQPERMYDYLRLMRERGLVMTLGAYMSALKTLAKHELLFDAKTVIIELVDREIVSTRREARYIAWEMEFWQVVSDLGNGAVMRQLQKEGVVEED